MAARARLRLIPGEGSAASEPEAGDLDSLFRKYAPYVAAIGLRILGRKDEVDDLVQDVFVEAQRGIEQLREPAAAKGWLATVAVRIATRRLRRRRLRGFVGLDEGADYSRLVASSASPAERALLAEVYRVLDRLPAEQRVAWTLRYVEGEELKRVGELCGCSLATVKRRVAAAHEVVRQELGDG